MLYFIFNVFSLGSCKLDHNLGIMFWILDDFSYCRKNCKCSSIVNHYIHSYKCIYEVNRSSACVIYLMECTLPKKNHGKKQYVGRPETSFNIGLNNHRKDVKKPDFIIACRHSQEKNNFFNKHEKFITIYKLQMPSNQKTFYTKDWLKEKMFGFKRCKWYIRKDWIKSLVLNKEDWSATFQCSISPISSKPRHTWS